MGYDGTLKFDTQVNTKGFESGANQITNLANGAVKGLSSILTKATSALTGLGKSVVQVGTQFETSMSNVAAISGATGDELDALTKKAQEMGAKTKFSASESADAFSYMAMAGWKTEEMLGGIEGIMNLAAASGEDLATTSDIVTDALTAFGLKASDSGHFADILAAASSNANTNVGLMGETFKYVAPVAGALGFSAEDTAQAIGLMANAGIKGSQAGTALRSVFSRLAKPTKQSQRALDDLGLSLTDDVGNVKDLNTLLLEMRQKFSTLSDAQKANYAALLAGQEGMSGLLAIVNASDDDWNKLAGAIDGCTDELTGYSAAEEMAAVQIDNLEGQVTILKSSLEGLKIKLYQGVETPLKEIVKGVQGMVQQLTDAFDKGGFDGLVSAVGDVLSQAIDKIAKAAPKFIDMAVSLVHSFCEGFKNADGIAETSAGLVSAIIKGIMSVVGDIVTTANYLIVEFIKGIGAYLPDLLRTGGELILSIIDGLTASAPDLFKSIEDIFSSIADILPEIMPKLVTALTASIKGIISSVKRNMPDFLKSLISILNTLLDSLIQFITDDLSILTEVLTEAAIALIEALTDPEVLVNLIEVAIELVVALADGLIKAIPRLVQAVPTIIGNLIKAIIEAIPKIAKAGVELFASIVNNLPEIIYEILKAIPAIIGEILNALFPFGDQLGDFFSGAWEGVKNVFSGVGDFFSGVWEGITNAFGAVGDWFKNVFSNAWEGIKVIWSGVTSFFAGIWNGIKNTFGAVGEWFKSIFSNAWNGIKSIWNGVTNFFAGIWNGIKNVFSMVADWFKNIFSNAWNGIQSIWNGVVGFFSGIWEGIKNAFVSVGDWFKNIFSGAWEGIKNAWNGVVEFFSGIWNGIKNAFGAVADWFKNIFSKAWEAVKNVFSTGGKIFDGIKDGIVTAFKAVVNAIIRGINKVVALPFNAINGILDGIRSVNIFGIKPFDWIGSLPVPQIPELARGGVLKKGQVGLLEGDGAEAVVPLERNTEWIKKVADQITKEMQANIHTEPIILSFDKELSQKKEQTINALQRIADSISESGSQAVETLQDIFNGLNAIEIGVAKPKISCDFDSLAESVKDGTETAKTIAQKTIDDINSFFNGFIPEKRTEDYLDRLLSSDLKQSVETPDFLKNARGVVSRLTGEIQATVNTETNKITYDKTAPQEYEQARNDRRGQTDINVTGQLESDRPIEVHTVLYLDKRKLAEEITPAVNHEMYKIDQRENNRGRGN